MRTWLVIAVLAGAATRASAQTSAPAPQGVEVMVVGTYHFDNPGLDLFNAKADDVLKPVRQRELEVLAAALADFRPTKVMIERVAESDDLVDPFYEAFTPAAFARIRDERVQLGYRLAHRLGHKAVYAIDEQPSAGEPDYFPFGKVADWAKANDGTAWLDRLMAKGAEAAKETERLQGVTSVAGVLAARNAADEVEREQGLYYTLLAVGDANKQPGADLNAMWYLRNAKIFAKLQLAARPGDRVVVIYGAGHNYWLRHFAATTPGYRLIDPMPYLNRAVAASR